MMQDSGGYVVVVSTSSLAHGATVVAEIQCLAVATLLRHRGGQDQAEILLFEPTAPVSSLKGKLERSDLLELTLRDKAVEAPLPFAELLDLGGDWQAVDDRDLAQHAADAEHTAQLPPDEFLAHCWQCLMARPFPVIPPQMPTFDRADRLLELPGTAGLLARTVLQSQPHLGWAANFVVAVRDRAEALLAGLVALECRLSSTRILSERGAVVIDPSLSSLTVRSRRYDAVLGIERETDQALAEDLLAPGGKLWLI